MTHNPIENYPSGNPATGFEKHEDNRKKNYDGQEKAKKPVPTNNEDHGSKQYEQK